MSYTPTSISNEQGLFDITRTLLQQPDLCALTQAVKTHVRQLKLADYVNILLWQFDRRRVCLFSVDEQQQDIRYEDETLLAYGPIRHMLSRPDVLHCRYQEFNQTWPQLNKLKLYPAFNYYSLMPLTAEGKIFGGCEFLRTADAPWTEEDFPRLQTLAQIISLAVEQIQSRLNNNINYGQLCRERDDFRLLVAITNAVLSKLNLDELITEVAQEIQTNFAIDSISVILRSNHKGKLGVYSIHYVDKNIPLHDQSEIDEKGTLYQKVMQKKEMLLLNLHHSAKHSPCESMLFELWNKKEQTLCLLPLIFSDRVLGVLKLAQGQTPVFTSSTLKLLRQIAERVAIAVDNALAYQEIRRLKERLIDENLALTEQINNVTADFGEIVGQSDAMMTVMKQVEMVAHSNSTLLILGETGTGKELIARAIHKLSGRNNRRMIKLNCAAMPAGLLESDLFGHERGAFTGASTQRIGRFEISR